MNWARGRIALVTGATSGIGLAFAKRILAAGGRVIATGRRLERLNALQAEAPEGRCLGLQSDIRDQASICNVLGGLPPEFSQIDILLNNAGLALGMAKAQEAEFSDWTAMIETNVLGLTGITCAVLPGMVARSRGHIINMGSVAGSYPYPGGNVYGATKAFVHQFSQNLRADLLRTPIKITCVEPGMVESEFSVVRFRGDAQIAANVYKDMKPLSADDIVDVIEMCLRLPDHVNINTLEVMPIQQAFGPFAVSRDKSASPRLPARFSSTEVGDRKMSAKLVDRTT